MHAAPGGQDHPSLGHASMAEVKQSVITKRRLWRKNYSIGHFFEGVILTRMWPLVVHGILTEREGSVQLTSSLVWLVL